MVLCSVGQAVLDVQHTSCVHQMLSTFWYGITRVLDLIALQHHIPPVGRVSRQVHRPSCAPVLDVFTHVLTILRVLRVLQSEEAERFSRVM